MAHQLWIKNEAKAEVNALPGHVRQRVRKAVQGFKTEPRPHDTIKLEVPESVEVAVEVRRLRLDLWRVVYVVDDESMEVGILAVRKRPPYDYEDLPELLEGL